MKIGEEIKQRKFNTEVEKAIVNTIYTYNWIRDQHIRVLKPHGILIQHYNILRILRGKHPEAVSPGEIKEVMLDKGNDVTRLIDKLVSLGFVKRRLCESNRRKMDVNITEKGLELTEELTAELDDFVNRIHAYFSEEDAARLSELLDKFRG